MRSNHNMNFAQVVLVRREAVIGTAEMRNAVTLLGETNFHNIGCKYEMRDPKHTAFPLFRCGIDVFASRDRNLRPPAPRPVSAQALKRHLITRGAQASGEFGALTSVPIFKCTKRIRIRLEFRRGSPDCRWC
jgi:hypothetical protein